MASKASRRRVLFAERVGAVKKEYDNEVLDLRQRAARLRERVRSNVTTLKAVVESLPTVQYNISDANDALLKLIEQASTPSDDNPVVKDRTKLDKMHKDILQNFDSAVQTMQSDVLELLYAWDSMFDKLEDKFKQYDKKRATYGHYGRKMQSLAAARKKRKDKGVAETVKNTQQWARNKEKFKDARVAHDGHKAEFIKVSRSLLATQEPRSNKLLQSVLTIQHNLFKGLVIDQDELNTTLQSIEHYIGSRRKELRTELDILESVDQDTVDPDDMMQQMLLHLLKTFFREAKVAVSDTELQGHVERLMDAPEPFFQSLRNRFRDDDNALEAIKVLVAAWNDLTAATISTPSMSGQWLAGDRTKCLKGHHLGPFVTDDSDYKCNICGKVQEKGVDMSSCRPCDFDVCRSCFTSTPEKTTRSRQWRPVTSPESSPEDSNKKTDLYPPQRQTFAAPTPTPMPAPATNTSNDLFGLFDTSPSPAPVPTTTSSTTNSNGLFGPYPVAAPSPIPGPARSPNHHHVSVPATTQQPERRKGPYIWDYTFNLWRHQSNGTFYNERTKLYTRNPGPGAVWLRLVGGKLVPVARQRTAPNPTPNPTSVPAPVPGPVPAPGTVLVPAPAPVAPPVHDPFAGLDFSAPQPVVRSAPTPIAAAPVATPVAAPVAAPAPAPAPVISPRAAAVANASDSSDDDEVPPPLPSRPSRRRAPKPPPEASDSGKLDPQRKDAIKIVQWLGHKDTSASGDV